MKTSICGAKCSACPSKDACPGCRESDGCPFGKQCFIAEYIRLGGRDSYDEFVRKLTDEINELGIEGMGRVETLYPLVGRYVNLEYPMPSGERVKLLCDDEMYLGAQSECAFDADGKRCFGVVARENFILVCEYGENCDSPELVMLRRR